MLRNLGALLLTLLAFCWHLVRATDIHGKVVWNDVCSSYTELGQAAVVLDDGLLYSAGITHTGQFVISNVSDGTYILSVRSHDHLFDQLRVDIRASSPLPEVRHYSSGSPLNPPSSVTLPFPLALQPRAKHSYFTPRESFNLIGMFRNPMMLMMVFAGIMMLAMPYLMKNLDPETLQEFNERHAKVASIQNSMASGDMKSGLSALLSVDDEKPSATSSSAKTQSGSTQHRKPANRNKRK